MSKNPEIPQSGESKNREVFDVFDRASSHKCGFSSQYFIGDGIVVRIGWVDNDKDSPDLTLELRDEKFEKGIGLTVDQDASRYIRETRPVLSETEWLSASREERQQARQFHRIETFLTPTASLEPIAQAVSKHDPHTEPEPPESERMYESSIAVKPLPSTDIEFIRELINAFSKPLD